MNRIAHYYQRVKNEALSLPPYLRWRRTNMAKALYVGWAGHGNLGDEALFHAISDLFSARYCFLPSVYANRRTVKHFPGDTDLEMVLLGGGTLIGRSQSYLNAVNGALASHTAANFIVFGTGVVDADMWEGFGQTTDRKAWAALADRSDYLSVRGPLSKKHLESWGVQREIKIIGDPALWYARDTARAKEQRQRLGLNFGPSKGKIHGQDEKAVLNFAAHLLQRAYRDGWQITLFPMIEIDLEYMLEAVAVAGIPIPTIHRAFLDCVDVLNALELQDVFIGEKLHSVILANCVYTPAIMLEYRTKCRDYMLSTGQEDLNFRTDRLDIDEVYHTLTLLYDNLKTYQARLSVQIQHWKSQLLEAASEVVSLVSKSTE